MEILFLIIHIIGVVVSYIVTRKSNLKAGSYSVGDRIMNIAYSLIGGWVSVFVTYFVDWIIEHDEKASW